MYRYLILTLICWYAFTLQLHANEMLTEANNSYLAGEEAKNISQRQKAFNKALQLYSQLEKEHHPTFGNGHLYFNIGNLYFNLEEYPLAILYYSRALPLMPRNTSLEHNLQIAQDKIGLALVEETSVFQPLLFLHHDFSFPERMQIFTGLIAITVLLASLYIWVPNRWTKTFSIVAISCAFIMLASLSYSTYFHPIEGIIIRSSLLYRAAGTNYETVSNEPVLSGMKVEVLEVLDEGRWLKVITATGELGFIPAPTVRLT